MKKYKNKQTFLDEYTSFAHKNLLDLKNVSCFVLVTKSWEHVVSEWQPLIDTNK